MKKSGQIALFLILVLAVLIAVFFLVYARFKLTNIPDDRQDLELVPVKLYVESCIDNAADQAFYTIGRQGGRIYTTQVDGTMPFMGPPRRDYSANVLPYTQQGIMWNVSYGIGSKKFEIPLYPYQTPLNPDDKGMAFGENLYTKIPLCSKEGANRKDLPNAEYSCIEYSGSKSRHSMQDYLEKYIENLTQECVDKRIVAHYSGLELKQGNIETQVLFGEEDVLIEVEYELTLGTSGIKETKVGEFVLSKNVRFKKIYELVYYMADEETKNVFFDMANETHVGNLRACPNRTSYYSTGNLDTITFNKKCMIEGFEVTLVKDPCLSCDESRFSDLVIVRDMNSTLKGRPYLFQFAVKNRPPALDVIDKEVDSSWPYHQYMEQNFGVTPEEAYGCQGRPENVCAPIGEYLVVYPRAVDPDGDDVHYKFSGWGTPITLSVSGTDYGGGDRWHPYGGGFAITSTQQEYDVQRFRYFRVNVTDGEFQDFQDVSVRITS